MLQYLEPRIEKNAELQAFERMQKDVLEKQILCLSSSIAIAFLCAQVRIAPDGERLKDLLQGLSLHFDSATKTCPEFERLISDFPEETWP